MSSFSAILDEKTHKIAKNNGRSPCKRGSRRVIYTDISAFDRAIFGESLRN